MSRENQPEVLVVEDNAVDFRIFRYAFSSTGIDHELALKQDGESALAFLRDRLESSGEMPRLILLDLHLPRMSGLDFLRALKAHPALRQIPVVVVSSSQFQKDVAGAYEAGASLYVRKPGDLDSLEDLVTAMAKVWLKYGVTAGNALVPHTNIDGYPRRSSPFRQA
jgi:CheY-like chemotaxis protein